MVGMGLFLLVFGVLAVVVFVIGGDAIHDWERRFWEQPGAGRGPEGMRRFAHKMASRPGRTGAYRVSGSIIGGSAIIAGVALLLSSTP